MKRVVKSVSDCDIITLSQIMYHEKIGVVQNGFKYIAAQVDEGVYILLGEDFTSGLNRKDDKRFDGTRKLVEFYIEKGAEVYVFQSSIEMLQWFIS